MGRESIVKETDFSSFFAERDAKKGKASWNELITLAVHEDVTGTARSMHRMGNQPQPLIFGMSIR